VEPQLQNRERLTELVAQAYPPALRDAQVGGAVLLWVHIDQRGRVIETRLAQPSGQGELDRVAQRVMRQAHFSPAQHQGRPVAVWLQLPVTFAARE
jgi:TonB family protein